MSLQSKIRLWMPSLRPAMKYQKNSLWNVGLIFPVSEPTNIFGVPVDAKH